MARTSLPTTKKEETVTEEKVVKEVAESSEKKEVDTRSSEIELLKEQNRLLMETLSGITAKLSALETKTNSPANIVTGINVGQPAFVPSTEEDFSLYSEPNPNQQIKVMSLTYGSLNLASDASASSRSVLRFRKYGEIKPVLYSSLLDIVNSNRTFAERGNFYILDKSAVYHLGLSEYYKNIVTKDILDNITTYDESYIRSIVPSMPTAQVSTMCSTLADRIYAGESIDLNKVNVISSVSGCNIMQKVEEMKTFGNIPMK